MGRGAVSRAQLDVVLLSEERLHKALLIGRIVWVEHDVLRTR